MTPTESLYKKYKPDFTQLPANFIEKDIGLRKLVRTKGDRYVSVYIAIQDGMGSHSAEDFTLSFDEMTDVVSEKLYLFSFLEEAEIIEYINNLISAGVLKTRYVISEIDNEETERYYIPSVAESLFESRDVWIDKCLNPKGLPKEEKAKARKLAQEINDVKNEMRKLSDKRTRLDKQLLRSYDDETFDKEKAKKIHSDLQEIRVQNQSLYAKKMALEDTMHQIISKGGYTDEK